MNPSRTIPEGVETVTAEGSDIARAVAAAAESMEIQPRRVEFKLDLSHFRSTTGTSVSRSTVKIIAWNTSKTDEELEAEAAAKPEPKPRKERSERKDRGDRKERGDRKDRGDRRKKERRSDKEDEAPAAEAAPPEDLEDTEASNFAREWFTSLMGQMDIEGNVKSGGNDERVQLWISAERAGRLIGKRGSTLGAIRHLLGLAVTKKFGDLTIDVDVEDNRPDRGERKPRRDRGNRRDRDRDRGSKRGGERSRYPETKLRALARRAAEKAADEDKVITINLELNSYDRRIVHLEIAEIDGVESRSEERDDGVKIIQVAPAE